MSLDQLQDDWTRLGKEDPLWAVYVAPGTKGGKWDVDAFFELGRREVDGVFGEFERLGITPGRHRALDFGCGVGRLSQALAEHVDEVVGIDISPTMLEKARELDADRSGGRCRFVLNEASDLSVIEDGSVDVVYSSLVLQHMPPEFARGYLREFARILAPGGVAAFQVASRPTMSVKGIIFRLAPWPILRWAQQRLLGYPAPMRMSRMTSADVRGAIEGTGARLVAAVDDDSYGGHWHYTRYYVAAPARPAPMRMSRMTSADVRGAIEGTGARLVAAVDDDSYGGHWHYTRYYVAAPGEAGAATNAEVSDSRETPGSSGSPADPSA